ncbi:Hypothetical protein NTJ_03602 [Nesidiocoris tenuis]|uniref:Alpha-and gamma-adaptin-binding protein p34 n=1 Tax=Nesidiocoris tenuis TaxID=355587 RepID=A0ABN7AHX4_9HEMI|nr:Hypothetical protein NTJ_03602 [Nesidiocoris tenuis]
MTFQDMSCNPCVIIACPSVEIGLHLVEEIVGFPPNSNADQDRFLSFPWRISNKYYEADVNLTLMKNKGLLPVEMSHLVQGVVLQFDCYEKNAIDYIDSWNSFLKPYGAHVKILLCSKKINEDDPLCLSKREAQRWCILNGFELVERHPDIDEEWEQEQDFHESNGILRVKQALQAHLWPNLSYKQKSDPTTMDELWHGGNLPCMGVECPEESKINDNSEGATAAAGNDLDGGVLLRDIIRIRDQTSKLPEVDRVNLAEQVVWNFWNSIGGEL